MNISVLNNLVSKLYLNNDQASFEALLVALDDMIDSIVYVYLDKFEDKVLYQKDDIKQELLILLWMDVANYQVAFQDEADVKMYLNKLAQQVLDKTRS